MGGCASVPMEAIIRPANFAGIQRYINREGTTVKLDRYFCRPVSDRRAAAGRALAGKP